MTNERIELTVTPREEFGSPSSRRQRRAGLIPGVLYGGGEPAQPFLVEERALRRALGGGTASSILDVVVEGDSRTHHAVVKDHQRHPTRGTLLHLDLHEVRLDR